MLKTDLGLERPGPRFCQLATLLLPLALSLSLSTPAQAHHSEQGHPVLKVSRAMQCQAERRTAQKQEPVWESWQLGVASWYGESFHDRRTANGERFDMNELTAAHPTLPFGTQVKVRNPRNNRVVVVRINDRGPFTGNRSIDLSRAAASAIGLLRMGAAKVELFLHDKGATRNAQLSVATPHC